MRLNVLELLRRDDRTDVYRLVQRRADAELLHPRTQPRHELGRYSLVHEQTRSRAAHLALIEPDRVDDSLHHAVEIRVVEDDERTLPSELKRQLLPRSSRRAPYLPPHFGRPCERDLVYSGMIDERFS